MLIKIPNLAKNVRFNKESIKINKIAKIINGIKSLYSIIPKSLLK